ncbi:peptidoglycan DD-metalloendopeptidase family protein [Novosphingobium sp. Gsoil 351]|nr:peptidoglycan DD-metalloendopeptidase family protein [Novosphingobium sp. Gsoil 351]
MPPEAFGNSAAGHPQIAAGTATADDGQPVRIQVGRALDFEGRPVYAGKSAFSGIAAIATFSRTRPVVGPVLGTMSLPSRMPLSRGALTSGFGLRTHPLLGGIRMHSGIDLAAPTGSPILATSDGVVGQAGWSGGYGLSVRLEHGGGLETRYGHMSGLAVAPGQAVRKGEVIGYVGSTGRSTGPHLHYEMRMNGVAVRPVM